MRRGPAFSSPRQPVTRESVTPNRPPEYVPHRAVHWHISRAGRLMVVAVERRLPSPRRARQAYYQAAGRPRYHRFGMGTPNLRAQQTIFDAVWRYLRLGEHQERAARHHQFAALRSARKLPQSIDSSGVSSAKTFPCLYDQYPISNPPAKPLSSYGVPCIAAGRSRFTDNSGHRSSVPRRRHHTPKQSPLQSRPQPAV
jgi:hypothetical protein